MINLENLIKIGITRGNTSNLETPDWIRRVGMSENPFFSLTMENFWLESELQMWTIGPD